MKDIFHIFLFELKIYCQDRFQKLILQDFFFFLTELYILGEKLSHQIKDRNSEEKRK